MAGMNSAAFHGVDAGNVDIGVPENIRKPGDILVDAVVRPGKQVAEIVREDFVRRDSGAFAQLLHVSPNVGAV